jgi:hypothetical protein
MVPYVPGSTNSAKIELYDNLSEPDVLAWQDQTRHDVNAWSMKDNATYAEALSLLDRIPPMRPGTYLLT